jgi:hypothetical protein
MSEDREVIGTRRNRILDEIGGIDSEGLFHYSEDVIEKPRKKLVALCCSEKCTKAAGKRCVKHLVRYAVKDVPYATDFCPDCDYALYWSYLNVNGEKLPSKQFGFKHGERSSNRD